MQTIYLVRHGETEWNRAGRMQGWRDSPLTPRGEDQARRVGRLLRELIAEPECCAMVVSPLGRTMQTAAIIAEEMDIDGARFDADPLVREICWGAWQGMRHSDIAAADPERWRRFRSNRWTDAPPAGESYAQLADRARQWLAAVADLATVLVVSHGGFGRILRGHYLRLAPDETLALSEPQDSVFRLTQGVVSRLDAQPADD